VIRYTVASCAALLLAASSDAQPVSSEAPPERMATLIVYGNDPCPQSKPGEILVCARQPESERYRLPRRFRSGRGDAAQQSWANRASALEYVGRAGTPNSCSPVGSGGQSGCMQQFLRQAREERRAATTDAAAVP
jgi:hypothetical protein